MMKLDDYLKEQNAKEEACCCAPTKAEPGIGMACLNILTRLKKVNECTDSTIYMITGKDANEPKMDDPGNIRQIIAQLEALTTELLGKVNYLHDLIV